MIYCSSFEILLCATYRSRHSLKISQRQPFGFAVSRRLWKSSSWISAGWRRTSELWRGGCSMHNRAPFCRPFRELVHVGSAAFAKSQGEARIAAELFALLEVLVRSGPICTFHLSFSNCLWAGCSYLLQNYIHLHANISKTVSNFSTLKIHKWGGNICFGILFCFSVSRKYWHRETRKALPWEPSSLQALLCQPFVAS